MQRSRVAMICWWTMAPSTQGRASDQNVRLLLWMLDLMWQCILQLRSLVHLLEIARGAVLKRGVHGLYESCASSA